ncbi:hypothetical protein [Sphingosinicella rhizophila]|uniref:Nuclear transport factor 2 family protein n=1 Tax=Sphingosinicella rhizophila TaxID=3050082 RepID=A0ABU3QAY7_9SPHN|nr:hypothetical protein [Sphingosinicella sp. GR2756]MDT9600562.1 hypothetical protein [Sphingosinicella sp. GR2756]
MLARDVTKGDGMGKAILIAAALFGLPAIAQARVDCAAKASDAPDVERTVKTFLTAIARSDMAEARKLTSERFHSFDARTHFVGPALLDLVEDRQKQGLKLEFGIGKVETVIHCDIAWAHWVNEGAIDGAPTIWQESGVLRRAGNGWIFEFLHSEKIPPSPAN